MNVGQQLHDYFTGQGYSDLEAHREANKVSGRCTLVYLAHNKPVRDSVNVAVTKHMPNEPVETPDSEVIDLGFNISEADVARPILRPGTLDATIAFVRSAQTQTGQPQMLVGYRTMEPAFDLNGKLINPGFTIVQRILMVPSGGYTNEMKESRLKRIHFAATGELGLAKNTAGWVGKPVRLRVTLRDAHVDEKTGQSYDASNEIGGVYPMPKAAATA